MDERAETAKAKASASDVIVTSSAGAESLSTRRENVSRTLKLPLPSIVAWLHGRLKLRDISERRAKPCANGWAT